MEGDVFGDPSLFEEFEKTRDQSDVILLSKIKQDSRQAKHASVSENGANGGGTNVVEENKDTVIRCSSDSESIHSVSDSPDSGDNHNVLSDGETVADDKKSCTVVRDNSMPAESDDDDRICELRKHIDIDKLTKPHRYRDRLQRLKLDNHRLKEQSRFIDTGKYFEDKEGPAVQVLYMDHEFVKKHKSKIERFISNLLQQDQLREKDSNGTPAKADTEKNAAKKDRKVIGCSRLYRHFTVDSVGWPLVDSNPSLSAGWEIPQYNQSMQSALTDELEQQEAPKPEKRNKSACFNCGGQHSLRECKEKRNMERIQGNRQQFQEAAKFGKTRYHGEDQRFSKFRPGVISPALREAMQLQPHQLPKHIYQMRLLGYPPGHLADVKLQTSGIALFDKDGNAVNDENNALEEGEIDTDSKPKVEHDLSKIISYPGFNTDLPPGVYDESNERGWLPMQPHQQKAALELFLSSGGDNVSLKRQRSNNKASQSNKKLKAQPSQEVDMDIVNISDEDSTGLCSGQTSRSDTPGLEELEAKQIQLLLQLEAAESGEKDDLVEVQILDRYDSPDNVPSDSENTPVAKRNASLSQSVHRSSHRTPLKLPQPQNPRHQPTPPPPLPVDTPPQKPPLPPGTPPVTPVTGGPNQCSKPNRTPLKLPKPQSCSLHQPKPSPLPPLPLETPPRKPPLPVGTPPITPTTSVQFTPQNTSALPSLNNVHSSGGSLSVQCSTPVLNIDSSPIPDASKFAALVSEHIPYENLPNATGTYERMTKVLKAIKMRKGEDG